MAYLDCVGPSHAAACPPQQFFDPRTWRTVQASWPWERSCLPISISAISSALNMPWGLGVYVRSPAVYHRDAQPGLGMVQRPHTTELGADAAGGRAPWSIHRARCVFGFVETVVRRWVRTRLLDHLRPIGIRFGPPTTRSVTDHPDCHPSSLMLLTRNG